MSRRFTGWPENAFDVLLRLDGDPPQSVRKALSKDRERLVREPMVALLQDVADADPAYEDFSVWGYGKMIWWWQHQCAAIRLGRSLELGMKFDLDGLEVQGAWWYAGSDQIARYRAAVADATAGSDLAKVLDVLVERGFEIRGDTMKRGPRGYPADHPRADLLRRRSVVAVRPLGCDDWLHTPAAVDRVLEAYADLRPMTEWFTHHVVAEPETAPR